MTTQFKVYDYNPRTGRFYVTAVVYDAKDAAEWFKFNGDWKYVTRDDDWNKKSEYISSRRSSS